MSAPFAILFAVLHRLPIAAALPVNLKEPFESSWHAVAAQPPAINAAHGLLLRLKFVMLCERQRTPIVGPTRTLSTNDEGIGNLRTPSIIPVDVGAPVRVTSFTRCDREHSQTL